MDTPDQINDYKVTKGPDGLATTGVRVFQPYGDHRELPVHAEYFYRALRPTTACFDKHVKIADPAQAHRGSDDDRFCMLLTAQPVDEVNCIIRLAVAINYGPELTEADIRRRQDAVLRRIAPLSRRSIPSVSRSICARSFTCARIGWVGISPLAQRLGVTYGTYGDEPPPRRRHRVNPSSR